MKRLAILVALAALVVAACGEGSGDVAATVNTEEITAAEVDALAGGADATEDVRAQALGTLVQWSITEQAAEEQFGFAPTANEIDDQIDLVVANAGAESLEQLAEAQGVSETLVRRYVEQLMVQDAVAAELESDVAEPSADEIAAARAGAEADWTTVCASHLLVETEEEALDALDRVTSGEEFAAVATEVSTDTASATNGGELGCSAASGFVEEFAEAAVSAPIGEPTGPVETRFGYHVIVVDSREVASDDDIAASLREGAVLDAVDTWFLEVVEAAEVEIADGYGEWVTEPTPGVVTS